MARAKTAAERAALSAALSAGQRRRYDNATPEQIAAWNAAKAKPLLGVTGDEHPHWVGDEVTYWSAHVRVRRARGPAKEQACIDCGGRAREWSLSHDAPTDRVLVEHRPGRAHGREYSPDPENYEPRCQRCHKLYDLAAA